MAKMSGPKPMRKLALGGGPGTLSLSLSDTGKCQVCPLPPPISLKIVIAPLSVCQTKIVKLFSPTGIWSSLLFARQQAVIRTSAVILPEPFNPAKSSHLTSSQLEDSSDG